MRASASAKPKDLLIRQDHSEFDEAAMGGRRPWVETDFGGTRRFLSDEQGRRMIDAKPGTLEPTRHSLARR